MQQHVWGVVLRRHTVGCNAIMQYRNSGYLLRRKPITPNLQCVSGYRTGVCEREYWTASATVSVTPSSFPSRSRKSPDTTTTMKWPTPPTSGHAQSALRRRRTGRRSCCAVRDYFRRSVGEEFELFVTVSVWQCASGARRPTWPTQQARQLDAAID